MAVTRKIRQKGADGAVTEVDIGALAANVVTDDERQFVSKAEKGSFVRYDDGYIVETIETLYNRVSNRPNLILDLPAQMTRNGSDKAGYVVYSNFDQKNQKITIRFITRTGIYEISGAPNDFVGDLDATLLSQRGADPTADDELTTKRYVDAAIAAGKPSSTPIYVNVPASGWQTLPAASGGGYVNTISVSGVKSTDNLEIVSAVETNTAQATAKVWRKMMSYIDSGLTGDGNVILICKDKKPTADFKIALLGV